MHKHISLLPGDGVGKEVMESAEAVLQAVGTEFGHTFTTEERAIGGEAVDHYDTPLPEATIQASEQADALLLGAVGGPKWDGVSAAKRPEKGLLGIRKAMGLFANLRPVKWFPALQSASPLKESVIAGSDVLIIRELTGGLYFGEPRGRNGQGDAVVDTLSYQRAEMERIVDKAFQSAHMRRGHVTSVDKANVLESSRMWREVVEAKSKDYPDVEVEHMLVDAAAMALITQPNQFDVLVTENMFGDILSDEASVLTGSLGMLPSASIRSDGFGLYEPVHGSAPDIAGQGSVNPLGMILSVALMLRHSFQMTEEASAVEQAVQETLNHGYHTADLPQENGQLMDTEHMTAAVIDYLTAKSVSDSICRMYV
ncbi:3-isopropylmalate dehydrogenase [Barrientosiimonas marina]|uniref:3-isopropylmalate dehydrogenase n=1 Tax=Lentibacillus kimchii TaxID=1542911 RepID=A0ABW2UX89_9BACI